MAHSSNLLNLSLGGEAMDALKQNLTGQLEDLKARKYKTEEMHRRVLDYNEAAISDVVDQLKQFKIKLHNMEEEIRVITMTRDEVTQDLKNVEDAYKDVLRKYERAKVKLIKSKEEEILLLQKEHEFEAKVQLKDRKFEGFKQVAQQNLEEMHKDLEKKAEFIENDNSTLKAQIRRGELRVETLKREAKRKRDERDQLNALVDHLIRKTASGGQL